MILPVAHYGEGYHAWEVTPEHYKQILKVRMVCLVDTKLNALTSQ